MKKEKKIEVSAKLDRVKVWDFGMFPKHLADKTIKINSTVWYDFVRARTRYEMIYEELKKEVEKLFKPSIKK